jgi:C1A family cysteine protease
MHYLMHQYYWECSYKSEAEESKRREIFRQRMIQVDADNLLNGSPVFGVTKFSDWTDEEFKVLLGRKHIPGSTPKRKNEVRDPMDPVARRSPHSIDVAKVGLPSYVNWATEGMVTPVKNQGQCGR